MEQTCENCQFWRRIRPGEVYDEDGTMFSDEVDDLVLEGECRRFPPVIVDSLLERTRSLPIHAGRDYCGTPLTLIRSASKFPVTFDSDYCGEWKNNSHVTE